MDRRFELRPVDHQHQAEQFIQYRSRGGNPGLWWQSKGFGKADQAAIQKCVNDLDNPEMTGPDRRLK